MSASTLYRLNDCQFPKTPVVLPAEDYWRATSALVRVCVDVVLVEPHSRAIYLAYRKIPWAGWWTFGGRVRPGEPEIVSAQRVLQEDAGIVVPEYCLAFLRWHRCQYFGQLDNQAPQDSLSAMFAATVSDDELSGCVLNSNEYDVSCGLRRVDSASIEGRDISQPIKDIFQLIYPS